MAGKFSFVTMQSLPNLNLAMERKLKGKWIKGMDKGTWAKGKESALWLPLVAGLRPARLCSPPAGGIHALALVKECAEEWVVEFVAPASDA